MVNTPVLHAVYVGPTPGDFKTDELSSLPSDFCGFPSKASTTEPSLSGGDRSTTQTGVQDRLQWGWHAQSDQLDIAPVPAFSHLEISHNIVNQNCIDK